MRICLNHSTRFVLMLNFALLYDAYIVLCAVCTVIFKPRIVSGQDSSIERQIIRYDSFDMTLPNSFCQL